MDAPRQDWSLYESRARSTQAARLRAMTAGERFDLYASLFNVVWQARRNQPGDWQRLDRWHWREKLAARHRMVEAFRRQDAKQRERAAGNDAD